MSADISSQTNTRDNYPVIQDNYSNNNMSELDSLIQILDHKIKTRDSHIKSIKYPNLLMTSLIELNQLVGMERLKDSISLQVMRLIDSANNGETSSKMLNTILYGPPGVGKTKVGIILSKIWFALGYLKKPGKLKPMPDTNNGIPNTTTINTTGDNNNGLVFLVLIVLFYLFTYIVSGLSYLYDTVGGMWLMFILGLLTILILYLYWNKRSYTYITNIVQIKPDEQKSLEINDRNINQINDRDIITVVSREDFVAGFLGQTAIKTKALLHANLGKVIFIDEAYSLLNGDRDQYGMEALTALNLFMSEYPDSIAVIFAGYKDLMKYGIFKAQPGLPRRCMWHFECAGYTGDQLSDIFLRQVYKDGWKIRKSDYLNIKELISSNKDIFPSYGGDTERLLFFSQLEASRNNMMSNNNSHQIYSDGDSDASSNTTENRIKQHNKVLMYEHIQHGLKRLQENNISEN
jgi:DNA polymerase III delta prime subunit